MIKNLRSTTILLFLLTSCKKDARKVLTITPLDFVDPTKAAIDIWNGYVGCDFLKVASTEGDVIVKSDDGEPCGDPWRPESEWNHDATAYQCGSKSEILVTKPGNIHTQTCIIAHEIGHVLGRPHQLIGAMSNQCYERIRISDYDVKQLRAEYCGSRDPVRH